MRNVDNSWDTRNAQSLFDHILQSNQSVYGFQLGNEPGHWYTHHENAPNGAQLGLDFITLKQLVDNMFGPAAPLLFGPDVCGPGELSDEHPCASYDFFVDLVKGGEEALDGITVHHYGQLKHWSTINLLTDVAYRPKKRKKC